VKVLLGRAFIAWCVVGWWAEAKFRLEDQVCWARLQRGMVRWRAQAQMRMTSNYNLELMEEVAVSHIAALFLMRSIRLWWRRTSQARIAALLLHHALRQWLQLAFSNHAFSMLATSAHERVATMRMRDALISWHSSHLAANLARLGQQRCLAKADGWRRSARATTRYFLIWRRWCSQTSWSRIKSSSHAAWPPLSLSPMLTPYVSLAVPSVGHVSANAHLKALMDMGASARRVADLRRCWHAWRTCDALRTADAIDALTRLRLGLHLARWARWWWFGCLLPRALSCRFALRRVWLVWTATCMRNARVECELLDHAIALHVYAAHLRTMRAFCRYSMLARTRKAAAKRQRQLNRIASLLEAMEVWRLPHMHARLLLDRVIVRALRWELARWRKEASWRKEERRSRAVLRGRLCREAWKLWRMYCTLPLRYDRLLAPLQRRPVPPLPTPQHRFDATASFEASLRPLSAPRAPFKLGSRAPLEMRRVTPLV